MDGGQLLTAIAEDWDHPQPGDAEHLQDLPVPRSVDDWRPHDRPWERTGLDHPFCPKLAAPVGSDGSWRLTAVEGRTVSGRAARRER
jgi:hypothetical protein